MIDPKTMFETTTYSRIFAQAKTKEPLSALKLILADDTQQKYVSGVKKRFQFRMTANDHLGASLGAGHEDRRPQVVLRVLPLHNATR